MKDDGSIVKFPWNSRYTLHSRYTLLWAILCSGLLATAWPNRSPLQAQPPLATEGKPESDEALSKHLQDILHKQARQWNEGNIVEFMQAYWKSDKLTFSSGGKTQRGWEATRDHYLASYPDRKTMGKLTFSELEVERVSSEAALMLGRWRLDRDKPAAGNFSLVWRKIDGQWVIIHDHSSSDKEEK